jgi:hypothetical protein
MITKVKDLISRSMGCLVLALPPLMVACAPPSTPTRLVLPVTPTVPTYPVTPTVPTNPVAPTVPAPPSGEPPSVDLTGQYTLTLLLSPSCTTGRQPMPFPSSTQTRNYDATITQRDGQVEVVFTPTECSGGYYDRAGICAPIPPQVDCQTRTYSAGGCALGSVSGHELTFAVIPAPATPECAGGDYWWEEFTTAEVFEACGTWHASIDAPARITGTVDGTFAYHRAYPDLNSPNRTWTSQLYCQATDHQFTLTKR